MIDSGRFTLLVESAEFLVEVWIGLFAAAKLKDPLVGILGNKQFLINLILKLIGELRRVQLELELLRTRHNQLLRTY